MGAEIESDFRYNRATSKCTDVAKMLESPSQAQIRRIRQGTTLGGTPQNNAKRMHRYIDGPCAGQEPRRLPRGSQLDQRERRRRKIQRKDRSQPHILQLFRMPVALVRCGSQRAPQDKYFWNLARLSTRPVGRDMKVQKMTVTSMRIKRENQAFFLDPRTDHSQAKPSDAGRSPGSVANP